MRREELHALTEKVRLADLFLDEKGKLYKWINCADNRLMYFIFV